MRIVLDLQGAQSESRVRGIGRYSLSLALALARNAGNHEIVIALNGLLLDAIEPIRAAFDGLVPQARIRVWHAPGPVADVRSGTTVNRDVAERTREAFLAGLEPDFVHLSSLFEGFGDDAVTSIGVLADVPTAVTLYDLIPLSIPHPDPAYRVHYERKLESLRRATLWFGISQFSCDEAIDALALPPERVINISCAADEQFEPRTVSSSMRTAMMRAYGISKPFVCAVGAPETRKNIDALFRAFSNLPATVRSAHQIVLIGHVQEGDRDALKTRASVCGLRAGEVIITGHVSDHDLVLLYNLCEVFAFPSLHEGFGLPALEAMRCGAAVITSNLTSLPEVVGLDEAMFDPRSTGGFTSLLSRVLTDRAFRLRLAAHGVERAQRFSWDFTARRALEAMESYHRTHGKPAAPVPRQTLIESVARVLADTSNERTLPAAAVAIARNHPAPRQRQLFVDVSELVHRDVATGVQRVTRSVLKGLLKAPPDGYMVVPVYATPHRRGYVYANRFAFEKFGVGDAIALDSPIDYQFGDIFLGLDLQHHVVIAQGRFYLELRASGVPVHFLIYDLLPITLPQHFGLGASELHEQWLSVISTADGVTCISRDVADRYLEWLETSLVQRDRPLRVSWCHCGSDIENSIPTRGLPADATATLERLASSPTFLTVGTIEPRKGHLQMILAFERLWRADTDVNLVIVGRRGWMMHSTVERLAAHPQRGKRPFWLEEVSDEYLEKLYAASDCLIAASEGEGYGLPLVEAARHGKPILARDIPVFREVAGNHARYFQGLAPEDLATAVGEWLALHASSMVPRPAAISCPTWDEFVERLKEILIDGKAYALWPSKDADSVPMGVRSPAVSALR
jgi:glycosyltransferase involved in cell wall biosynthesis